MILVSKSKDAKKDGLFLLESGLSKEEGVAQAFPLLVRGKAKTWYDGLQAEEKTWYDRLQAEEKLEWSTLEASFQSKYVANAQLSEVKRRLDELKQSLAGHFQAFVWDFEALWSKLIKR
ncbi:hypothetical protein GOP47_0005768 [Adiantum capillus-veneris]|uniref:Retrotransposon gag domain-containing protein n=1 Tax=Adiantum capillus-veneris TaxID=13818 RepID=A0A9D4ZLW4_ADICA|nr:hypothetical protein GOP47_0005768 [Adiantum capillus-veneris]